MRTLRTCLIALTALLLAASLITPLAFAAPAAPTGLNGAPVGSSAANLIWNSVDGAANYRVYCGTSASKVATIALTPNTNYTATALFSDTTYYFKVQAVSDGGEAGPLSPAFSLRTQYGGEKPKNLKAISISSTQIDLTWQTVYKAAGYTIYRAESSSAPYVKVGTTNEIAFRDASLPSGRRIYYKVRAIGTSGEGTFSASAYAYTSPAAPTGPVAKLSGTNAVKLTWSAATGATKYRIYRSTEPNGPYAKVGETGGAYYTVSKLSPGALYYFKISAVNQGGEGDASGTASALLRPPTPTGLKGTAQSSGSIRLTWNAAPGATQYAVYRSTSASGKYARIGESPSAAFTDEGLAAGKRCYYKVSAINASGESAQSAQASERTPAGLPAVPSGLKAQTQDAYGIKLTWKASSEAARYAVYRAQAPGGPFEKVGEANATSYADKGLAMNTAYYYQATAINAVGESAPCGAVAGKTAKAPPRTPTGLFGSTQGMGSIALTWDATEYANRYAVYRSLTGNSGFKKVGETESTAYLDQNLRAGTRYYYRLAAIGAYGTSAQCAAILTRTSSSVLAAPGNLRATPRNFQSIDVTYDPVPGAAEYRVYYTSYLSSTTISNASYLCTDLGCRIQSLSPDTTYYIRVVVVDPYGAEGTPTNYVAVATSPIPALPPKPHFSMSKQGDYWTTFPCPMIFDHSPSELYPEALDSTFTFAIANTEIGLRYAKTKQESAAYIMGEGVFRAAVPYGQSRWFGFRAYYGPYAGEMQVLHIATLDKLYGVRTASADTGVILSWSIVNGAPRYNLYVCTRAPEAGQAWVDFKEAATQAGQLTYKGYTASRSYTFTDVPAGAAQCYIVVPADSAGTEGWWCGYAMGPVG